MHNKALNEFFVLFFVCALFFLAETPAPASAACNVTQIRKEWRQLSLAEQTAFLKAVKALSTTNITAKYNYWPGIHYSNSASIHGYAPFFPWHRQFLVTIENALRAIDPTVKSIPYWDWSLDSQAPDMSPVWYSSAFGGQGNPVSNGIFANWKVSTPTAHLLSRQWDGGYYMSSFYSPELLNQIITYATSYDAMRRSLELNPHGIVHNNIGGDMASMASPNDPIFFLHHAFMDRLWARWQARSSTFLNAYGGVNANGAMAKLTDVMQPFGVPVSSVMSISTQLCYTYSTTTTAVIARRRRRHVIKRAPSNNNTDSQKDPFKLHKPRALPLAWIQKNNLDLQDVRNLETTFGQFIDKLNNAGYKSPFAKGKGPFKSLTTPIRYKLPPGLAFKIPPRPTTTTVQRTSTVAGKQKTTKVVATKKKP